jgi:SHS2 domain-containing protein
MSFSMKNWSTFEHDADIGVRGEGSSISDAFEMAALALGSLVTHPQSVKPQQTFEVSATSQDLEFLLVAFLNELIFELEARGMVLAECQCKVTGEGPFHVAAVLRGEPLDPSRHELTVLPKGATLTQLQVARLGTPEEPRWTAQCIVDV